MMEQFRKIPGLLNYDVSDSGRVRSGKRFLKPRATRDGYLHVRLHAREFYVHRLVYTAFVGNILPGFHINHLNGIRDDNRLDNLEAVTPKQNKQHATQKIWYNNQTALPGFGGVSATGGMPKFL